MLKPAAGLCGIFFPMVFAVCFFEGRATAATEIQQVVTTEISGAKKKKLSTKYVWTLDRKKFRLDLSSEGRQVRYVFNGRTLYVCGALSRVQLDFLKRNKISDSKLLQRFEKGACQAVPANFLARFFLAPIDAVEAIDRSDGLSLTLALKGYSIRSSGKSKSVAGKSCDPFERSYTLTRKTSASDIVLETQAREALCDAEFFPWRKGIWREVSKAVVRQPGGRPFMASLKKDKAQLRGLVLDSRSQFTSTGDDGSKRQGVREIRTVSVKEVKPGRTAFRIPSGYEVFAPESVDLGVAPVAKQTSAKTSNQDFIGRTTSLFFCAIAGAFGCLGH